MEKYGYLLFIASWFLLFYGGMNFTFVKSLSFGVSIPFVICFIIYFIKI